jgi:hypothetical protein
MLARVLAVWVAVLLSMLAPQAMGLEPGFGTHGMALFGGKDGLYASHLPMFHAPHDAQVVLRIRFEDPALDRVMRERLDGKTALWTLDPERFALPRLAPGAAQPLAGFAADVVEGHFEQGGVARHRQARIAVDEVILYRPLEPAPTVRSVSRYLPVGRFMVKLIDSRPDFDHIVLLQRPAGGAIDVPKAGMEADMAALAARVPVIGTVYYCAEDLR